MKRSFGVFIMQKIFPDPLSGPLRAHPYCIQGSQSGTRHAEQYKYTLELIFVEVILINNLIEKDFEECAILSPWKYRSILEPGEPMSHE